MNLKKKAQVIMLDSINESPIYQNNQTKNLWFSTNLKYKTKDIITAKHLYIVDDSEIKEPCYAYCKSTNSVHWLSEIQVKVLKKDNWNKVIVSTDKSLKLPSPSEQFIQKYVELYNKGIVITDIMIEWEKCNEIDPTIGNYGKILNAGSWNYQLKVDSKNQVTITRCKDSWDREEVLALIDSYISEKENFGIDRQKWIKNNL